MGRRRPRLTLMSRSFFSLHLIGHLKKKERESESERGVAAARNGAPAMVSSSMILPVYFRLLSPPVKLRGNITRSLRSNSSLKKKIQLRSWFLHRRCSWSDRRGNGSLSADPWPRQGQGLLSDATYCFAGVPGCSRDRHGFPLSVSRAAMQHIADAPAAGVPSRPQGTRRTR